MKKFIYTIFFIFIACPLFSQTKKEAENYVNYFFNSTNTFTKSTGGFTFSSFNNTIRFNSLIVISDPVDGSIHSSINKDFISSIDNIERVNISSVRSEKGYFIVLFSIFFKNEVLYEVLSKKNGVLPEKSIYKSKEIPIMIPRDIQDSEFSNFKKAVEFLLSNN